MKIKLLLAVTTLLFSGLATAQQINVETLSGDRKTACEVVLCLSTGNRPSECAAPLRRFFSISHRRFRDTLRARRNFLNLCPSSNSTNEMSALVNAMARGAGACDAAALNQALRNYDYSDDGNDRYTIRNQMPDYCQVYANHEYTRLELPLYVGIPRRGGHWVERDQYPQALAAYNRRIAREDCRRQLDDGDSGYISPRLMENCVSRRLSQLS